MKIPHFNNDPTGTTYLLQIALKELGYYKGQADNLDGPLTRSALKRFRADLGAQGGRNGLASSFADPDDVIAFKRCKRQGGSDQQCFKKGDNGIGAWNEDTTKTNVALVAIPRDVIAQRWGSEDAGKNKLVRVQCNGKTFTARLADKMPLQENVENGAVIDLNPGSQKIIGKEPPFLLPVTWWWLDDLA